MSRSITAAETKIFFSKKGQTGHYERTRCSRAVSPLEISHLWGGANLGAVAASKMTLDRRRRFASLLS